MARVSEEASTPLAPSVPLAPDLEPEKRASAFMERLWLGRQSTGDVVFQVGGRAHRAHRLVVQDYEVAPFFSTVLSSKCLDAGQLAGLAAGRGILVIQDVSAEVFELLLEFMYRGEVAGPFKGMLTTEVLTAADTFFVDGLQEWWLEQLDQVRGGVEWLPVLRECGRLRVENRAKWQAAFDKVVEVVVNELPKLLKSDDSVEVLGQLDLETLDTLVVAAAPRFAQEDRPGIALGLFRVLRSWARATLGDDTIATMVKELHDAQRGYTDTCEATLSFDNLEAEAGKVWRLAPFELCHVRFSPRVKCMRVSDTGVPHYLLVVRCADSLSRDFSGCWQGTFRRGSADRAKTSVRHGEFQQTLSQRFHKSDRLNVRIQANPLLNILLTSCCLDFSSCACEVLQAFEASPRKGPLKCLLKSPHVNITREIQLVKALVDCRLQNEANREALAKVVLPLVHVEDVEVGDLFSLVKSSAFLQRSKASRKFLQDYLGTHRLGLLNAKRLRGRKGLLVLRDKSTSRALRDWLRRPVPEAAQLREKEAELDGARCEIAELKAKLLEKEADITALRTELHQKDEEVASLKSRTEGASSSQGQQKHAVPDAVANETVAKKRRSGNESAAN